MVQNNNYYGSSSYEIYIILSYHLSVFILVLIEYTRTPKISNAPTSTNLEKTATVTAVMISTAAIKLDTCRYKYNTLNAR